MVDLLEVLQAAENVRLEVGSGPHEVEVVAVLVDLRRKQCRILDKKLDLKMKRPMNNNKIQCKQHQE